VYRRANHQEDEHKVDIVIFHRGSLGCHQASPRCVDQHLMVRRLIGIHNRALPKSTARTYRKCGSSMTHSTRVALREPHGVSTIPLTNPPPEPRTISTCASTESQATKPSRRWQPLRVTSTTGLQHDHLVPLDVISQCNRTRIAHSLDRMNTINHSELEGSQAHQHKPPRPKGAQQLAKASHHSYL
jgi:hypothetical protein